MKILITGASGLIGTALQKRFAEKGWDTLLATRHEPKRSNEVQWSIEDGFADLSQLEGIDAVVHLAGESVNGLRWTDEKKKAIRESRVRGTHGLVSALSKLKPARKFWSQHRPSVSTASVATRM
jgi:NAD dependent epimerase/dehydratase family enzyme